jgi:hypothetical protein
MVRQRTLAPTTVRPIKSGRRICDRPNFRSPGMSCSRARCHRGPRLLRGHHAAKAMHDLAAQRRCSCHLLAEHLLDARCARRMTSPQAAYGKDGQPVLKDAGLSRHEPTVVMMRLMAAARWAASADKPHVRTEAASRRCFSCHFDRLHNAAAGVISSSTGTSPPATSPISGASAGPLPAALHEGHRHVQIRRVAALSDPNSRRRQRGARGSKASSVSSMIRRKLSGRHPEWRKPDLAVYGSRSQRSAPATSIMSATGAP